MTKQRMELRTQRQNEQPQQEQFYPDLLGQLQQMQQMQQTSSIDVGTAATSTAATGGDGLGLVMPQVTEMQNSRQRMLNVSLDYASTQSLPQETIAASLLASIQNLASNRGRTRPGGSGNEGGKSA